MDSIQFCSILKREKITLFTGVPDSLLKGIIKHATFDPEIEYLPAVKEDAAIGIATGAYLAGKKALVIMQNSGLANSINALASLNLIYRIPVLLLISWRGKGKDAPEHLVMGRVIIRLLKTMGIPTQILTKDNIQKAIKTSIRTMNKKKIPVALVLRKGIIK